MVHVIGKLVFQVSQALSDIDGFGKAVNVEYLPSGVASLVEDSG